MLHFTIKYENFSYCKYRDDAHEQGDFDRLVDLETIGTHNCLGIEFADTLNQTYVYYCTQSNSLKTVANLSKYFFDLFIPFVTL